MNLENNMIEKMIHVAPSWFTVVAVLALIWNLMGVMAYVMQVTMSPETLAALPEEQRQLYETTPVWATAAFAIAVNGGVLGSLLLLLKRNLAGLFLQLSLIGVVVQMFHAFFMSQSFEVLGPGSMVMPIMVIVIAVYLVILAVKAQKNRWTS
jgi:surface polysaccharide O-acyltransferase-like enzyme